jgi:hypothetical protein
LFNVANHNHDFFLPPLLWNSLLTVLHRTTYFSLIFQCGLRSPFCGVLSSWTCSNLPRQLPGWCSLLCSHNTGCWLKALGVSAIHWPQPLNHKFWGGVVATFLS